ncbi:TetR family transcriptional regulator [Pararhizobium polonicum]|uniref:TetR family transcriptional regulator n=1 Tax=Pararhizobium polonicum TaxID=1612624 RepID=A0A1C7NUV6_9HYPH|nr:TetR/AcrR family transcriptional regulator [Pararhizobium polonicum]OBZ92808.1 TetR family transcriptional regulator [Pararhizobium polonicum]
MARHKSISDEALLDAVLGRILSIGPSNLTFAQAGKAAGLSPATLVQRYGDKDSLLEAALLHAWSRLDQETAKADAEEPLSPDGAIRLLLRLAPGKTAESDETDGLLILHEDIRNPVLRARGAAWGAALAIALGRRLTADTSRATLLGWQMAGVWLGARIWWAFTRQEPFDIAIRRSLEEWCSVATSIKSANA